MGFRGTSLPALPRASRALRPALKHRLSRELSGPFRSLEWSHSEAQGSLRPPRRPPARSGEPGTTDSFRFDVTVSSCVLKIKRYFFPLDGLLHLNYLCYEVRSRSFTPSQGGSIRETTLSFTKCFSKHKRERTGVPRDAQRQNKMSSAFSDPVSGLPHGAGPTITPAHREEFSG